MPPSLLRKEKSLGTYAEVLSDLLRGLTLRHGVSTVAVELRFADLHATAR